MEQTFLHGTIRERLQDLMKSRKVSQAELAARIDCSESMLSRFLSGRTDKLGDVFDRRLVRISDRRPVCVSERMCFFRRRRLFALAKASITAEKRKPPSGILAKMQAGGLAVELPNRI